jgi:hypothetical protein
VTHILRNVGQAYYVFPIGELIRWIHVKNGVELVNPLHEAQEDHEFHDLFLAEVLLQSVHERVVDTLPVVEDVVLGQIQGDLDAVVQVGVSMVEHLQDHLFRHAVPLRRSRSNRNSVKAAVQIGGLEANKILQNWIELAVGPEQAVVEH